MDIKGVRFLKRLNINAIVLWPFIFYADKNVNPFIRNHERIHWDQIKRDGVIFFYARYLREYFSQRFKGKSHDAAYRGISYEVEAYHHQQNIAYTVSKKNHAS